MGCLGKAQRGCGPWHTSAGRGHGGDQSVEDYRRGSGELQGHPATRAAWHAARGLAPPEETGGKDPSRTWECILLHGYSRFGARCIKGFLDPDHLWCVRITHVQSCGAHSALRGAPQESSVVLPQQEVARSVDDLLLPVCRVGGDAIVLHPRQPKKKNPAPSHPPSALRCPLTLTSLFPAPLASPFRPPLPPHTPLPPSAAPSHPPSALPSRQQLCRRAVCLDLWGCSVEACTDLRSV